MLGVAGLTAIDTSAGGPTVSVVEPLIAPKVAVIAVLPCARDVASPALLTPATAAVEEVQVAVVVRFCVLPLV
jgi:hypothetical protein